MFELFLKVFVIPIANKIVQFALKHGGDKVKSEFGKHLDNNRKGLAISRVGEFLELNGVKVAIHTIAKNDELSSPEEWLDFSFEDKLVSGEKQSRQINCYPEYYSRISEIKENINNSPNSFDGDFCKPVKFELSQNKLILQACIVRYSDRMFFNERYSLLPDGEKTRLSVSALKLPNEVYANIISLCFAIVTSDNRYIFVKRGSTSTDANLWSSGLSEVIMRDDALDPRSPIYRAVIKGLRDEFNIVVSYEKLIQCIRLTSFVYNSARHEYHLIGILDFRVFPEEFKYNYETIEEDWLTKRARDNWEIQKMYSVDVGNYGETNVGVALNYFYSKHADFTPYGAAALHDFVDYSNTAAVLN